MAKAPIISRSRTLLRGTEAPNVPVDVDELQRSVLGILIEGPKLFQGAPKLAVTDFLGSVDQAIYAELLRLADAGEPADPIDLAAIAERAGVSKGAGMIYISKLTDGAVVEASYLHGRIAKLQKCAHVRRVTAFCEHAAAQASKPGADPSEVLGLIEKGAQLLRQGYDLDHNLLPYSLRKLEREPEIVCLDDIEALPVDWLWQPYLPFNELSAIVGDPGAGKTFIACAIAAAFSIGKTPYTGKDCPPYDAIYMTSENSPEYVLRPRFDRLEGNPKRFHVLTGTKTGDGKPDSAITLSDLEVLDKALTQTKARILFVDPLQSYLGSDVDLHRSNETRPILDGLALLARQHHAAIVVVRHMTKGSGGKAIHRAIGGVDLSAVERCELQVGELEDEERVMTHCKTNIGPIGQSLGFVIEKDQFRWTGPSEITSADLAKGDAENRKEIDKAVAYLEEKLAAGPMPVKMLEEGTSIHARTLRRGSKKLGVIKTRFGESGSWSWTLRRGE